MFEPAGAAPGAWTEQAESAAAAAAAASAGSGAGEGLGSGSAPDAKPVSVLHGTISQGRVLLRPTTNQAGGTLGGISTGADIEFRVAIKPVSTIGREQQTAGFDGSVTELKARGRHDPCVLPRAPPLVEGMAAIVLADATLVQMTRRPPVTFEHLARAKAAAAAGASATAVDDGGAGSINGVAAGAKRPGDDTAGGAAAKKPRVG